MEISLDTIYNDSVNESSLPFCLCGCLQRVEKPGNKFIDGHNMKILGLNNKGKNLTQLTKLKMSKSKKGKPSPMRGKILSEETKYKLSESHKGQISCWKGKKLSSDHRLKISINHKGMIGKHHSPETILKITKCRNFKDGMLGKHHSEKTKEIMRISAFKRMEKLGISNFPKQGKNEKYILDEIENAINLKILRNDNTLSIRLRRRSCDGYCKKFNLPLEVLESGHFKSSGDLCEYDKKREIEISNVLGCMIYYIPEQEFLKNQEKEIQRFRNFILELEHGRN